MAENNSKKSSVPKAQFFIITAVVVILIFSGLYAKTSNMIVSIPKKEQNTMSNYICFVDNYNNAIRNAENKIEANINARQIVDDQKKMLAKKDCTIKYAGEFGFFDGFKDKNDYLEISSADYFFYQNNIELNISAGDSVNLTYDLTEAGLEFDADKYYILDMMIKANDSLDCYVFDDDLNTGFINLQKQDEFVFYTNNTGLRGLVENITFSFSAFVPTKIIIDYIGIRTNRNIEISSNNAFISRND